MTYTLAVSSTGQVALHDESITVDVSDVLDNTTIDVATLPAGVTLDGTTLVWSLPALAPGESASITFSATVSPGTAKGQKLTTAIDSSLGGFCAEDTSCQTKLVIARK